MHAGNPTLLSLVSTQDGVKTHPSLITDDHLVCLAIASECSDVMMPVDASYDEFICVLQMRVGLGVEAWEHRCLHVQIHSH